MWYDAIILALVLFCTVRGAAKGFAWQVAAIGALVLCFLFAETGSLALAPLIKVDPPLNRWIAMFVLYLGASFVSFAAAKSVRSTLEKWQFVEYDKHLGALFGMVKGVAFGLVITFFAVTLNDTTRALVLASYSGYSAGHILSVLHPVMPAELHAVIDPYLESLGRAVVHDEDFGHNHDAHDSAAGEDFGRPPGSRPTAGDLPVVRPARPAGSGDFGPSPDFGPLPDWSSDRPASSARQGTAADDLTRLVKDIPADLRQTALDALRNTKPQDRDELLAQFSTAIPGLIKAVASEWQNGKPASADRLSRRDKTLREIAGVYTTNLDAQRQIIRQAEDQLRGLPDSVSETVLQDWYADLLRLEAEDPDPATRLQTPLDARIRRQLSAFGVSPDTLSADLRGRLGTAPR